MSIFSLFLPNVVDVIAEASDRHQVKYGDPVTIAYPVSFEQAHASLEPTNDPRFAWLLPYYGTEATDIIKNFVEDMEASGRGALVGVLAEGFDSINEIVIEFLPGVAPKVTRTYVWDEPQIDFAGEKVTIRRRKTTNYTSVEAPGFPNPFRVWLVFKPIKYLPLHL